MREMERRLKESHSESVSEYLREGRDPALALRKMREEVYLEDPGLIPTLRQKDLDTSLVDEKTAELALEVEGQLIEKLRGKEEQPAKKVMTTSQLDHRGLNSEFSSKTRRSKDSSDKKPRGNGTDGRVTFRMDTSLYERFQRHSRESGVDSSTLVRSALTQFLDEGSAVSGSPPRLAMPPEAFESLNDATVWPKDHRVELKERFLKIVAMSYSAAKLYPKTRGLRELHVGLLKLCPHLGIGKNVGQP